MLPSSGACAAPPARRACSRRREHGTPKSNPIAVVEIGEECRDFTAENAEDAERKSETKRERRSQRGDDEEGKIEPDPILLFLDFLGFPLCDLCVLCGESSFREAESPGARKPLARWVEGPSREGSRRNRVFAVRGAEPSTRGYWPMSALLNGSCRYFDGSVLPAGVSILAQTVPLMSWVMNFVEPSHIVTTTPPGWLLLGKGNEPSSVRFL